MLQLDTDTVSSFCSTDKPMCVQVRLTGEGIEVRDSKLGRDSPVLTFTGPEWAAFTAGVKAGEFEGETARTATPMTPRRALARS